MALKRRAQSTILWGPAGTGKTSIIRALSREVDATFWAVNATNATVVWTGAALVRPSNWPTIRRPISGQFSEKSGL